MAVSCTYHLSKLFQLVAWHISGVYLVIVVRIHHAAFWNHYTWSCVGIFIHASHVTCWNIHACWSVLRVNQINSVGMMCSQVCWSGGCFHSTNHSCGVTLVSQAVDYTRYDGGPDIGYETFVKRSMARLSESFNGCVIIAVVLSGVQ